MHLVHFISLDGTHNVAVNPEYVVAVRGASHLGIVETVIRTISSAEQIGEKYDDVVRKLASAETDNSTNGCSHGSTT